VLCASSFCTEPKSQPDRVCERNRRRVGQKGNRSFGFIRRFSPVRLSFRIAWALLIVSPAPSSQGYASTEYRNKANFLVRFLDFVEWPEASFPSPQAPFVVCVRGDFLFGTSLAEMARGSSPQGKRVEVRWLHDDQKLRSCHILFVSRSESKRYTKILQAVAGADVLTIGETPDFLDAGGAMSFTEQVDSVGNPMLQFEVSLLAASSTHLRISSKLLAVARRVVKLPEDKKS
jgi:YfiR/HmsC-like